MENLASSPTSLFAAWASACDRSKITTDMFGLWGEKFFVVFKNVVGD